MNTPAAGMKPSIGRIVIYHCKESDNVSALGAPLSLLPDMPAIITRIWSDTVVNLIVFWDTGSPASATSVPFGTEFYNWSWPERV